MKTFNVLPTSDEFTNLTGMQKEFIWQNYLEDNPKLKSQINNVQYDDEFNDEWDKLEPSSDHSGDEENLEEDYLEEDLELAEMAKNAHEFLQSNKDTEMESARERLKRANVKIDDVDDWEEVE